MNKAIIRVFMVVAVLLVVFICWQVFFNDGGVLKAGYNALADGINGQWAKVAGEGHDLIPQWSTNLDGASGGFEADVK